MILVTGGLGFAGMHVTRALLDLGESCVVTQHRATRNLELIEGELGSRVSIEQVDVADLAALLAIGMRHPITGIVHLAAPGFGALDTVEDFRVNTQGLLNVLQAAQAWAVARVSIASSIGVYAGVEGRPFREDMPLPMVGVQPIETIKKSFELLATCVAGRAGFEVVNLRFSALWGPLGRADSAFFAAPRLVHAAVRGQTSVASPSRPPVYAEDGMDLCYAKDCGRAVALLQTAPKLRHPTYNVGSGYATANREVAAAIQRVIPGAVIELADGRNPHGAGDDFALDITRLREDTGFAPTYNVERAVEDYIAWLRAGHER